VLELANRFDWNSKAVKRMHGRDVSSPPFSNHKQYKQVLYFRNMQSSDFFRALFFG